MKSAIGARQLPTINQNDADPARVIARCYLKTYKGSQLVPAGKEIWDITGRIRNMAPADALRLEGDKAAAFMRPICGHDGPMNVTLIQALRDYYRHGHRRVIGRQLGDGEWKVMLALLRYGYQLSNIFASKDTEWRRWSWRIGILNSREDEVRVRVDRFGCSWGPFYMKRRDARLIIRATTNSTADLSLCRKRSM